jgi:hypothetical protein
MRVFAAMVAVSGAAAPASAALAGVAAPVVVPAVRAVASSGSWGRVIEVADHLNAGGTAGIDSVSCPSPGNCAAGGRYSDHPGQSQAFVISERNGSWGPVIKLAGNLSTGYAEVTSLSCPSPGNCVAAGSYQPGARHQRAFVADEKNGSWDQAIEVPGLGTLNKIRDAQVLSVSCGSAGNCAAGGQYIGSAGHAQAFVASESNGRWDKATELAAVLNARGNAQVASVSCSPSGRCAAGGFYTHRLYHTQAFLISRN